MRYKVPFVDVPTQFRDIQDPVLDAVIRVLSTGDLILRDDVRRFEERFAALVGTGYAVGVNSGTDAVHFALVAAGLQPGEEVITVSHGCIATLSGIVHAGGKPVLVDVGDDFNIDARLIERAITGRTRAIVPVHLNGRACDMDAILCIARRHNLLVVEDCAQALGAKFGGTMVGSFGAAAAFSLYPFKILGAYGDAGCVVTNDPGVAKRVAVLRDYGQDRQTGEILEFGYNSKLDNLQAAILNVKLQFFHRVVDRRREIAATYHHQLADLPAVRLPRFGGDKYHDAFLNYGICVQDRDSLVAHLKSCGIEPLTPLSLVKPLHQHSALGFRQYHLPNTERVAREFIYLPIHPELTDEQVQYVIDTIRSYYGRAAPRRVVVQGADGPRVASAP